MIKINLVAEAPSAAPARKKRSELSLGAKQNDIILLTVLLLSVAVVGTNWFLLHSKHEALKRTEAERRRERDELKPFIDKVEELEAKREALKHKIDVINELKNNQRGPVRIMDEVSRALPELVWLTNMKLEGTTVTLTGMAMDENAVANYIANLKASPFFEEPSLKDLRRSQGDSFQFVLNCPFTYAPPGLAGASPPAAGGAA